MLKIDVSLVDHLAEAGYQWQFGARELKRRIRQALERRPAREILSGTLASADSVHLDKASGEAKFSKTTAPSKVKGQ